MKYLFTVLMIFISNIASAQIVYIPDPLLKQDLLTFNNSAIDANGDGEIQVSEALAIISLGLQNAYSDMTGIQAFQNLTNLDLTVSTASNLDLSNMLGLETLQFMYNPLPGATNYPSINLSGCMNLQGVGVYSGGNLANPMQITFGHLPRLKGFGGSVPNHFGILDFTGCDSVTNIMLGEGDAHTDKLDISGLTQLPALYDYATIDTVIARNCTTLDHISPTLYTCNFKYLDVAGCTNLRWLDLYFVNPAQCLTSLDLSTCINLKVFETNSDRIQYINIKNGSYLQTFFVPLNTVSQLPLFICADDFEIDSANHLLAVNNTYPTNRPFYMNSYCSFYPGGTYNTIQGKARVDLNNNGCDNGDPGLGSLPISFTDTSGQSIINYTSASGNYDIYTYKGLFTVHPYFPYPYFTIAPSSATVQFDTANSLVNTTDFCISPNGVHNDLTVNLLPTANARPGFNTSYRVTYKNRGNTTLSGSIQLNYDNSKVNFINASVTPASQNTGQLIWNYSNMLPFETRTFEVTFYLYPPPTNNAGDTLHYLISINPVVNDETPSDNSFILPQGLRNSYDPNEKLCAEGTKIGIDALNDPLHYIIHFQNMGNDTAFNIVVADTLTNNVDWNSFDFISSSHPCRITRKDNKLEFYFNNIKLPYQTINDAGSNGYVAFEVKPKSTLVVGDSINNTASIYFDFNTPVVTNRTTTIVSDLSTVPVKLEYFSLSSKDQSNLLTWKVATTDLTTTFNVQRSNDGIHFNDIGHLTVTAQRCQLPFNFADVNPLTGKNYYRIKITDANGVSFYSKTLVTGKTKSGFDITAIISDQNNTILYLNVSKDQTVQMRIMAADGRLVYSQSKTITAGMNNLSLQTGNLAKGVYSLVVYTNDGEMVPKKFIK